MHEDGDLITTPLHGPLLPSTFLARPNRFLVRCRLGEEGGPDDDPGDVVEAHLPDPGRLEELLVPGRRVWLRPAAAPHRKTRWTAVLVQTPDGEGRISVDTTLPNRLVGRALEAGALEELSGWELDGREVTVGGSRFDFVLRPAGAEEETDDGRRLVLEVKSVTLVEDGVGLFPDAVTARGARHVRELAELAGRPDREAAVLFVLQRPDARRVHAARSIDPDFARALSEAKEAGVRVLARRCRVEPERVVLGEAIPAS